MAAHDVTMQVHLDIDVNGEPITHLMEVPGTVENPGGKGLTVHLHLDAAKLAKALAPYLARELSTPWTDGRQF